MRRAFLFLAAVLIVLAPPTIAQQRYEERLPYAAGNPQAVVIPVPSTFTAPAPDRCFATTSRPERYQGLLYWSCFLNNGEGGRQGAALFAYDGTASRLVYHAGQSTANGSIWIDQGQLYFSWIGTADRVQRNILIAPGQVAP